MVNKILNCSCKKMHVCSTENVFIERNVIKEILPNTKEYRKILILADETTYELAGKEIKDTLSEKVKSVVILKKENGLVIPNEKSIETIERNLFDCDLIFGVGSGVINDLSKYVSFTHNLPYMIFGTAPSMDGYVSVGSALILGGMKITLNARPPKMVFADIDILKNAPIDMIRAGYGDIIGKFSCLNDWKLSALINDEYFCQTIYDKVYETAERIKALAEKIISRNAEAVGELMKALIDVGVCMSYVGNSRPASGSEHHLSHYFEITGIINNSPYFPHGIDVGFSSVVTAKLREEILQKEPKKIGFDKQKWQENIKRIYKSSADGIITLQNKLGLYEKDDYNVIIEKWDKIKEVLSDSPKSEDFLKMLSAVGLNINEYLSLYGEKKIKDGVLYAKDLKDRYTVLWLYYKFFREEK